MKKQSHFLVILVLGCMAALGPFSIDMYLPAFSTIARDLGTDVARVALSLSSYFIGISVGQLFYGPLLDRFGRKRPLYFGLVLYIVAALGCVWAKSIETLILLRFFQALGSCAASVAAMALVRDLFPVRDGPKIFAMLMLVIGVSPMLAPTIGGYVSAAWGWQSVFVCLVALGVALLVAVTFWLPAGEKPDPDVSLKPTKILKNYLAVLKVPQFSTYAFAAAIAFSGLFTYVAGSPMVFMELYGLSAQHFGWVFAFLSISLIGAGQVNRVLLRYWSSEQVARSALLVQALGSVLFLAAALTGAVGLPLLIVFLFVILGCVGLTSPNTSALSLAPFTRNVGSAAAVLGALQMGMGTLASMLLGLVDSKSTVPMSAVMAGSSVIALLVLMFGRRRIRRQSEPKAGDMGLAGH